VRHAGQLKLLCSEIDFLLRFGEEGSEQGPPRMTVIYAGAAPGLHIPKLAQMFGHLRFVLIDPAESAIEDGAQIRVVRARMTNELAAHVAETYGPDLLFVSDVRVGPQDDGKGESGIEHQLRVQADMDAQLGWHHILNPVASMLKFRLPWDLSATTTYLDGEIRFPIFGRALTHEARLVVRRGARHVQYDNARYERQMAFFNQHRRPMVYAEAGGRCYDCTAFRALMARFVEYRSRREDDDGGGDLEAECQAIEDELQRQGALWTARWKKKPSDQRSLAPRASALH